MEILNRSLRVDLVEKRVLTINREIGWEVKDDITQKMHFLQSISDAPITLHIAADGGGVDSGLCIYDAVRFSSVPVYGVVTDRTHSISSVILQGCTKRIMWPNAEFGVHLPEGHLHFKTGRNRRFDQEAVNAAMKRIEAGVDRNTTILLWILSSRSGLSKTRIEEISEEVRPMKAERALKLGFIDEIAGYPPVL